MPNFQITAVSTAGQTLSSGQSGVVTTAGTLAVTNGSAITSTGYSIDITVAGSMSSINQSAITHSGDLVVMKVLATGNITSSIGGAGNPAAITINSVLNYSSLTNLGTIAGDQGVFYDELVTGDNRIYNGGTILADGDAFTLYGAANYTFINTGQIIASYWGIFVNNPSAIVRMTNTGLIRAETAILALDASDSVTNKGIIYGAILLNDGTDLFDTRGGVVHDYVNLGAGNDTARPGAGLDTIDGGGGTDTLEFIGSGATTLSLAGLFEPKGVATEDSLTGFENLVGSHRADRLGGNASANQITGNIGADKLGGEAGADTLLGGAGADKLTGGKGADQLTGGAGNDRFIFNAASDGGDTVTDYKNILGNDDLIAMSRAGFAAGLALGTLKAGQFVARGNNLAQDADDRFIFNTADKTLWFDGNGNAAGRLVLLADLQASATLTAADILIIG